jgi:putative ABC transport system ATP-binding protein
MCYYLLANLTVIIHEAKILALDALKRVGLSHRMHHYPHEISGGELQRVAIARAIAKKPSLILADEPTGNLDSENAKLILNLLQEIQQQGATIITVTHDEQIALEFPRLIKLRDGRIIADERKSLANSL